MVSDMFLVAQDTGVPDFLFGTGPHVAEQLGGLRCRLVIAEGLCGLVSDDRLLRLIQNQRSQEADWLRSGRHLAHYVDHLVTQVFRLVQRTETLKQKVKTPQVF